MSSPNPGSVPTAQVPNPSQAGNHDGEDQPLRGTPDLTWFMNEADQQPESSEHSLCEGIVDDLWNNDPHIQYIAHHLRKKGCPVERENIKCGRFKDKTFLAGWIPGIAVFLAEDLIAGKSTYQSSITHELIHAYDSCRAQVDWTNIRDHACSEVRAASLSGDCKWTAEMARGNVFGIRKQHQICARRRAILSVLINPNSHGDSAIASQAVDDVFEKCFADTAPWDSIPY